MFILCALGLWGSLLVALQGGRPWTLTWWPSHITVTHLGGGIHAPSAAASGNILAFLFSCGFHVHSATCQCVEAFQKSKLDFFQERRLTLERGLFICFVVMTCFCSRCENTIPKKTSRSADHFLTFLLLKYSPTKWPINTIYRMASRDAC